MATTEAEDNTAHLWKLLDGFRSCMLVTKSGETLRSRPMAPTIAQNENAIWFLTDRNTAKDDEIEADSRVCLTFSDAGSRHVSISGTALPVDDIAVIQRLWTPAAKAFWPDGPTSPGIVALRIVPERGEYWDGPNALVTAVRMAYAAATGSTPDLGENEKVRL